MTITTAVFDARKRAALEAQANDEKAQALDSALDDIRKDIARLERRRDSFKALGAERVEIPQRSYHPGYRTTIEWEPIRSKKTGAELAADVEANLPSLRAEAARLEKAIKKLIAD